MGEGYSQNYKKTFWSYVFIGILWNTLLIAGSGYYLIYHQAISELGVIATLLTLTLIFSVITANIITRILVKPTEYLANAIMHISPNHHLTSAPNMDNLTFGKEFITALTRQIYDFASVSQLTDSSSANQPGLETLDSLPVAVIGLDKNSLVTFANQASVDIFAIESLAGSKITDALNMKFIDGTIEDWVTEVSETSVKNEKIWRKVDIRTNNGEQRSYFDVVARYRKDHPSGTETILVFCDQNNVFQAEDEALNLVALAVHEIRTPLTILRGYIEVLEEELSTSLTPETRQSMQRMSTASESLSAFVANILSVAKADQDQLNLRLIEEDWQSVLTSTVATLQQRATVRGMQIHLAVTPELPKVALDKISIAEVITNLIDNSIKYSTDKGQNIWVESTLDKDGMIQTTVRDEGVGIPDSVVPNLFAKFSRNHRNRNQIAGTGLGLFLSKSIVNAHKGNIWVRSKEGEGTTIGFTLLPFSKLAEAEKKDDNGITRTSHGWIKNHSMQRR